MGVKFYSKEWMEEVKARMENDKQYQSKAKDLSFKSQYVLTDCPGGIDKLVEWTMNKGILTDYKIEEKSAPSDYRKMPFDKNTYLMKVTGSYETYRKMNRKELSPMMAIMTQVYKIEGPQLKILGMMGGMNAMQELMAAIDTEF